MTNTHLWTDAAKWRDRWELLEKLPGGGQGDALRAKRLSDGAQGFLKIIKAKKDPERRARFFREASAYHSFRVEGVPALIESNAHRFDDLSVEPYIATNFIEGPTLRQWREGESHVPLETAVALTRRLLQILDGCHSAGCVHRDVKPDNLILKGGDPEQTFLLDFGLNYHELPAAKFETENWQEVGNRFLRLPELSAGSPSKQDPRSDLTFAAGILYFVVTGEHPDVLEDAEGRLPHQRSGSMAKLQAAAGARFAQLAALFDTAFAPRIADRFDTAAAMQERLRRMMRDADMTRSPEEDLAAILEVVDTNAARRRVETHERLSRALTQVQAVFSGAQQLLKGQFVLQQGGFQVEAGVGRNTLSWLRPGTQQRVLTTKCEARETGDELVVHLSGESVFRTDLTAPTFGEDFQGAIRSWLLAKLRDAVTNPDALPPEAHHFEPVAPLGRLDQAAARAQQSDRPVLAFVYDPSQPDRSKLDWSLGNFLQNKRTRELMNSTFVTALVPLSEVATRSAIVNDQSMEQARWVIFDVEMKPIEQAVIYANPQEAERIMTDLARRYAKS